MHNELKVQVSDTTMLNRITSAGAKNYFFLAITINLGDFFTS